MSFPNFFTFQTSRKIPIRTAAYSPYYLIHSRLDHRVDLRYLFCMALHEQSVGATDEWYTPPYVFDALDCEFDLDVAHPGLPHASWVPARAFRTPRCVEAPWRGFVWMNPPFGGRNGIVPWLEAFMRHGDGVALVPDRTSAPWWQTYAAQADCILFVSPKIKFIGRDGLPGKAPAQGTCLLARGALGRLALHRAALTGKLGLLLKP